MPYRNAQWTLFLRSGFRDIDPTNRVGFVRKGPELGGQLQSLRRTE